MRLMTRYAMVILTCFAALTAAVSPSVRPTPKLIWNASASVPIGLYVVRPAGALRVAELVVVRPPQELARFLAARGYLPQGVPLLKRVAAIPGQIVCRDKLAMTVDGATVGDALERDRLGRPLPVWQGCHAVPAGEVFLLNRQSEDSFDGRYFGSLPATTVIGRAEPLWINH
jgi:conjugative transfer signal peptidase TraF